MITAGSQAIAQRPKEVSKHVAAMLAIWPTDGQGSSLFDSAEGAGAIYLLPGAVSEAITCESSSREIKVSPRLQNLAEVLDEARNVGERVWWLMHISVGINDYNTVKNDEPGSLPVEF